MKWLTSLFGGGDRAQPKTADENVQSIDLNSILFTIPTISGDLAPLEPVESPPGDDVLQMHEDDWCQVEFFNQSYVPELERLLKEYKTFEAANRQMTSINGEEFPVWRKAYLRKVVREPLLTGANPVEQFAAIVGGEIGPAPVLFSSSSFSGRVKDGFTLRIGRSIELYGFIAYGIVPVIAASVGPDPDDRALATAFSKLHAALGLVLIDWKAQFLLLDTNAAGQISVWRP